MEKKKAITYNAPIDIYYEYQFVMRNINDYLKSVCVLDMKPKVSETDREYLRKLNIVTFKDAIDAKKDTVEKIFQNKRLFRFFIEFFSDIYQQYEYDQNDFVGKRAINLLNNVESDFLKRPINLFLSPKMYVRICHAFKNHKKRRIETYKDLKRYINDEMDMLIINGVGTFGELVLYTIVLVEYKYWKSLN